MIEYYLGQNCFPKATVEKLIKDLFDLIDINGSLSAEKVCVLSRVMASIRKSLSKLDQDVQKQFYETTIYFLESDKKKITSNAIRMAGILLSELEIPQLRLLMWSSKNPFGGLDKVMKHYKAYLNHEFAKYGWIVTCSLAMIASKFKAFENEHEDQSI